MPTPRNYFIAATIAALITVPAFAGSTDNVQSVAVSITGYDLSSESGAKLVLEKIESAAKRVCDVRSASASIRLQALADVCVVNAVSNAVMSLDAPVLSRVHADDVERKAG